jgi:cytochrome c-type biogenesis protein CcmH/NrfG
MEAATQPRTAHWSTAQAYLIAVCCLLLGAAAGYFVRASRTAPAVVASPEAHSAMPQAAQQPTPDQMKHMADKQAEPLLAKLQATPNDADLLANIGGVYYAAQQFTAAVPYYERAVAARQSAKNLVSLGNAYYYGEAPDKALAAFQRALTLEPGSPDALFNIGVIKWQSQGDPKGAVEAWQKLLKANPDHPHRAQVEDMITRAKSHIGRTAPPPAGKPTS